MKTLHGESLDQSCTLSLHSCNPVFDTLPVMVWMWRLQRHYPRVNVVPTAFHNTQNPRSFLSKDNALILIFLSYNNMCLMFVLKFLLDIQLLSRSLETLPSVPTFWSFSIPFGKQASHLPASLHHSQHHRICKLLELLGMWCLLGHLVPLLRWLSLAAGDPFNSLKMIQVRQDTNSLYFIIMYAIYLPTYLLNPPSYLKIQISQQLFYLSIYNFWHVENPDILTLEPHRWHLFSVDAFSQKTLQKNSMLASMDLRSDPGSLDCS